MYKYLKTLSLGLGLALLTSACSSKNSTITKIENDKKAKIAQQINITSNEKNLYKIYIDEEDKLKFICSTSNKCFYYNKELHSSIDGLPEEEIFYINKKGYESRIPKYLQNKQCGFGSYFGFWAILDLTDENIGFFDFSKKNNYICNSKFSEVDSYDTFKRILSSIPTFGTSFFTAGTRHTRKFDSLAFSQSLSKSKVEFFRKELINTARKYKLDGGFDIIYLEKGDIDDSLDDKYDELLESKTKNAGVIFLDEDTNEFLSMIIFDKYKNTHLIKSISLQINELIADLNKNNHIHLKDKDIKPYIPKEISLPKLPKIPVLKKSEFEKKSEFNKRVEEAVRLREEQIRKIQRQYNLDVFERNAYIDNLQKGFEYYLKYKSLEQDEWTEEIKENIDLLSKVLLLENISSYKAKDFNYDAEQEKLYFTIYSLTRDFTQKVFAKMDPKNAKSIKQTKSYKILPDIDFKNGYLILNSFEIIDTKNNDGFEVKYTNLNYKPDNIKISIINKNENISPKLSATFKQYKQKNKKIKDNVTIGYEDVVSRMNARVPRWFIQQNDTDKIIGYGEDPSLTIATANARKELAYMIKVTINTILENKKEKTQFKSFSQVKQESKQSSNVELSSGDYKIFKKEKLDGRWYVALEFNKK